MGQQSSPTFVLSLMCLWAVELRCRVLMTPSGGGAFTMAELTIWGIHRKSSFLGSCRQKQTIVRGQESQSPRKALDLMQSGTRKLLDVTLFTWLDHLATTLMQ